MEILIAMTFVIVAPAAACGVLYYQTGVKAPRGLGPLRVSCPHCGKPQRFLRLPTTAHEFFFGGYTCGDCGCRINKCGGERFARSD